MYAGKKTLKTDKGKKGRPGLLLLKYQTRSLILFGKDKCQNANSWFRVTFFYLQ